jgi:hypothetical protein
MRAINISARMLPMVVVARLAWLALLQVNTAYVS